MVKHLRSSALFRKSKHYAANSKFRLRVFLVAFALIGVVMLIFTSAATPTASVEVENGASLGCPKTVPNSDASGGSAVQFTNIANCGWEGLDSSGNTIPITNYTIPNGAIFMSPTTSDKTSKDCAVGNDNNTGRSAGSPYLTLEKAITQTPAGGTIVVCGGEHRQAFIDSNKLVKAVNRSMTFQAYPGDSPWFNGSDIVTDWQASGSNQWVKNWQTPHFCNGNYRVTVNGIPPISPSIPSNSGCTWKDTIAAPTSPVAADPQTMFINDEELTQVPTLAEVTPGSKTFHYDWYTQNLTIGINPTGNKVEVGQRPAVMVMGGAFDFKVLGIGFHRHPTGIFTSLLYAGLGGTAAGGKFTGENMVFSYNAGQALDIVEPKNQSTVRRSVFAHNHFRGLHSNGFANQSPGTPNSLILESNIFNRNNSANADLKCSASCNAAGVKLNNMAGYTAKNNLFENTGGKGPGLWCDIDCSNGIMINNTVRFNGGHGIFYEISSKGIIANNLIYNNGGNGIEVASATTKVYNNTIVMPASASAQGVRIWDDNRPAPEGPVFTGATCSAAPTGWPNSTWPFTKTDMENAHNCLGYQYAVRVGPNTRGVEFANNVIVSPKSPYGRLFQIPTADDRKPNTVASEYFNVLDHNFYYAVSGQILYGWDKTANIFSLTDFKNASGNKYEGATQALTNTTDNPFVNRDANDYRLKVGSPPVTNKGRAIPQEVAAVLGISESTRLSPNRGVIGYPAGIAQ